MKCIQCGFCCFVPWVGIVKDPEMGPIPENVVMHFGKGPCPHLQGTEPGKFSCAVSSYIWFETGPCGLRKTDFGEEEEICSRGQMILEKYQEWKNDHPDETWGWSEFVESVKS